MAAPDSRDRQAGHAHDHTDGANAKTLTLALILTTTFIIAEVAGAFVFNSLALLSDAAHMMTDVAALAIALLAIRIGDRRPDDKRTYGYKRFEILAAAFNALLLFAVAIYVLVEAIKRFQRPETVQSTGMLIVAIFGLVVNLISMRLLAGGKDKSLNVKGAYLEVWADCLDRSASSLARSRSASPGGSGSIPWSPSASVFGCCPARGSSCVIQPTCCSRARPPVLAWPRCGRRLRTWTAWRMSTISMSGRCRPPMRHAPCICESAVAMKTRSGPPPQPSFNRASGSIMLPFRQSGRRTMRRRPSTGDRMTRRSPGDRTERKVWQ